MTVYFYSGLKRGSDFKGKVDQETKQLLATHPPLSLHTASGLRQCPLQIKCVLEGGRVGGGSYKHQGFFIPTVPRPLQHLLTL